VIAAEAAVLEAVGVTKVFPGTTALSGVDFRIRARHVHALIGENGAGKSTLVKILAGIETPTSGRLLLEGAPVRFHSVTDAARQGIGIIHQELQLFPNLSIAENLFVGRELRGRLATIDANAQRRAADAVLTRLGQPLASDTLVGSLPLGLQQVVEIAKALVSEPKVLLMDEPTSALTPSEIDLLFRIIRDLTSRGVAIVYISHRLEELLEIADAVTVLRDGRVVGESPCADIDVRWIVERMTGRTAAERPPQEPEAPREVVLSIRDLELPARPGRTALQRITFDVRSGEVVAIYGLMGAGRTELFESLLGVYPDALGHIVLNGRELRSLSIAGRVRAGLAMVPEDRQAAGLVQTMDVVENMTLSSLDRFWRHGWLALDRERQSAADLVRELRIKTPALTTPIGALSGGNQQKVVISRAVMSRSRVLLLDEPTRGVDVAAKAEILAAARRLARDGMAVLYASSDLDEIFAIADRIVVLSRGRLAASGAAADMTPHMIASAASRTSSLMENLDASA
jgi:erythritol transport system ATP-binding protein